MKTRIGLICAAALPALLLQGCAPHRDGDNRPPAVQVDTAETYGSGRTLEFPGRVKAAEEVNLAFQIPGTLLRVHARQGTSVRQGELIAELDERDYRLRLEAVEAEYENIRAEAERVIALYADSVATPDAYDKARYGLRQIEAKYESCRNQLADTKIYAPFDGIVQRRLFDPPTVVAAGMPVVTLLSGSAPEIEINIPGSEYVRRGEFAAFEAAFDFWPGRRIPLRLLSVAPKANANQLYTVRLGIPAGTDPMPAPGMNTMVSVSYRPADTGRTSVPATALFREGDASCVWVFAADSTVHRRAVAVESLHTDGRAVLSSGLDAGERIVSSGVHRLHEGQKTAPLPAESETNVGGLL